MLTKQQTRALAQPCARAIETIQPQFAYQENGGFVVLLTVNK